MPTIVAFIIVFGTIVFFHELGHFLVAKLAGVVVYEFALGFGPRLVHTKKGETVYSIRLLPLGGFVKLAGMDEPESELESIGEQHPGNFNNKPLPVRLATIAAGPYMNFVSCCSNSSIVFSTDFHPTHYCRPCPWFTC